MPPEASATLISIQLLMTKSIGSLLQRPRRKPAILESMVLSGLHTPMYKLVLVRHGESTWNLENRFTGWTDVDLTPTGIEQAKSAGRLLKAEGYEFDVCHTSVLKRAIHTLWHCLDEMDRQWLPTVQVLAAQRAPLRRPAGPEQGRDGQEVRRRAGAGLAPQLRHSAARAGGGRSALPSAPTRATRACAPSEVPLTECLKDTVDRVLPYWNEAMAPAIRSGKRLLVSAHGNSIRALVKYLDGISDADIVGLNIPNGIPLVYELDAELRPIRHYYLGDAEAAARAAAAVANQGKG